MDINARFDAKVTPGAPDACWLWSPAYPQNYGTIRRSAPERGTVRAHRLAYERANGPIPKGLLVCHRCDVPGCVNPAHLFLGTHGDNQRDRIAKGR